MANICIIFGGNSVEYSISLQSVYSVLSHLPTDDNHYYPIGITENGQWFYYNGDIEYILNDTWHKDIAHCQSCMIPANNSNQLWILKDDYLINRIHIDAAFIMIHGNNGEDGTIASLLQLANITNLTCPPLAGSLAYDKYRSHLIAKALNINVANCILITNMDAIDSDKITNTIGYPCIVKPNKCGSSFGISLVHDEKELLPAIQQAFTYDNEVLVEQYINGCEVGVSIITKDSTYISSVDKIEVNGIFDTNKKYESHDAKVTSHAFDSDLEDKIKQIAYTLYQAHSCDNFARIDCFLSEDNTIYFNEINTIPGFTTTSRFPNMCASDGITFDQLITQLLTL